MKELQIEPVAVARLDNRKADVAEPVRVLAAQRPQVVMLVSRPRRRRPSSRLPGAGHQFHLHLAVQHQQQRLPAGAGHAGTRRHRDAGDALALQRHHGTGA
jgi:hypothetical protein